MSKRSRWLFYLIGALTALVLLIAGMIRSAWFQRELRRQVVATLEDLTGGRVEIRDLQFRLSHLQLIFHGLVLRGAERDPEPPLVSARSMVAGFSPLGLLHRRKLIRSFEASDAEIRIRRYSDGTTNLPVPRAAQQGPQARPAPVDQGAQQHPLRDLINLSIGKFVLERTSVFLNDERLNLELEARDVGLRFRLAGPGRYTGDVSASELRLTQGCQVLPPIEFSAQLDSSESQINLSSLTWKVFGLVGQGSGSFDWNPSFHAELSVGISGELRDLARQFGFHELRGGKVRLEGKATFSRGALDARGRIQARQLDLRSPSIRMDALELSADYSADLLHLEVPNFVASALGGSAQGRAEISWRDGAPKVAVASRLRGFDLGRVLRAFPEIPVSVRRLPLAANVGGTVDTNWQGSFTEFHSRFDLELSRPNQAPLGIRPLAGFARGEVTLARGLRIEVRESQFRTDRSALTAHGTLQTHQSDVSLELRTSDFEDWRSLLESLSPGLAPISATLKSNAAFRGSVSGTLAQPRVQGQLSMGEFVYRGWTWSCFETSLVAAPDLVQLTSGKLSGGGSQLTVDLSLGLDHWALLPGAPVHIRAEARKMPLEGLRAALDITAPVNGLATGHVELSGTMSQLTGSGHVRLETAAVADEPINSFSADVQASGQTVNLGNIQLTKGRGHLTGQLRIEPLDHTFSAELQGSGFSLSEIRYLGAGAGPPRFEGIVNLSLKAKGTLDNVQFESILDVPSFSVEGNSLGRFTGRLDGQGKRMRIEMKSQGPEGKTLAFGGEVRTEGDWPLDLKVEYTNFPIDPWIRLWGPHNFEAGVTATGSMTLAGPLKSPHLIEVHSTSQNLQVSLAGMAWSNDHPVEVSVANQTLTVSPFQMHGPSTHFRMEGRAQLREPVNLSLTADGEADARLLSLFDPSLQAIGRFAINLRATGAPVRPLLYGTLHVENVSLGYADVPIRLAGLKGDAQLQGDRITIGSLRGETGRGSLTLAGFVTLATPPRVDLHADLDQARIQYPVDISEILSGTLDLVGTAENANLTGNITVSRMSVPEEFNLLSWVGEVMSPASQRAAGVPSSTTASNIHLDVGVASDPDVRLQSQDLKLVATIDMRLKGTLANPVGFGDIHTESGEVLFQGNRFKLTRGDIALANPYRTVAVLDVEAQTHVEHYEVTINITGPADRFRVSYRSDPPLPSVDVLNLLASGYAPEEQAITRGTASTPTGAASASAGLLLSPALYNEKARRVQRLFGISRFRIDPNVGGPSGAGGSRITVEEQIAPNLSLTYIYVTATPAFQQRIIHFDWDINERTELIGERDQNGVYGLELRFHHRFK